MCLQNGLQNLYYTIEIEIIHVLNGKSLGSQFHPDMATSYYLSSFTTIEKCISCSHLQSPPSAPISKLIKKEFRKKNINPIFFPSKELASTFSTRFALDRLFMSIESESNWAQIFLQMAKYTWWWLWVSNQTTLRT